MKHLGMAALAAGVLCASPALASTVIYSNFSSDPGSSAYPYTPTASGYYVDWAQTATWFSYPGGTPVEVTSGDQTAMSFTVSTGYDIPLQSVSLAMYKWPHNVVWDGGGDVMPVNHDNLTVELVGGDTTLPDPGDLIATLVVNPTITEDTESFLTLGAPTHPVLQDGKTYWVIAKPTATSTTDSSDDSVYVWIYNEVGAKFNFTVDNYNSTLPGWQGFYNASTNQPAPTLEVLGESPAPEPGTLALFGTGILGLLLMRGRQARGAATGRTRPGR